MKLKRDWIICWKNNNKSEVMCVCVYVCISATSMLRSDGGVARVVAHINGDRFDYTDWKWLNF